MWNSHPIWPARFVYLSLFIHISDFLSQLRYVKYHFLAFVHRFDCVSNITVSKQILQRITGWIWEICIMLFLFNVSTHYFIIVSNLLNTKRVCCLTLDFLHEFALCVFKWPDIPKQHPPHPAPLFRWSLALQ